MSPGSALSEAETQVMPRVPGAPMIGNTRELAGRPAPFSSEADQRYGPFVRVDIACSGEVGIVQGRPRADSVYPSGDDAMVMQRLDTALGGEAAR